jgi:hypothetical protein
MHIVLTLKKDFARVGLMMVGILAGVWVVNGADLSPAGKFSLDST